MPFTAIQSHYTWKDTKEFTSITSAVVLFMLQRHSEDLVYLNS